MKGALGWLAPKGLETVAPGKRSAARSLACEQFKSPGRATELSVALPGLTPLIARTPGCASLARGYSLSALPGRESLSIGQTHVYKLSNFLTNAGIAEHFRVSPPEAVVYNNGIRRMLLTRTNAECLYERDRVHDHVQDEVQVHRGEVA